jgi:beta-lactamase class A
MQSAVFSYLKAKLPQSKFQHNMRKTFIFALILLSISASAQKSKPAPTPEAPPYEQRLKAEVVRLSAMGGGKLGVTAIHIETGKGFSQFGGDPFPMASSYKVPIAVQLLTKVDSGKLSLDQMVEFSYADLHIGSGMIAERFDWPHASKPGVALSVRSLLELMLLISDNSATDMCLKLAGGAGQVNACMDRLGISGIHVDRPTSILIADWLGAPWPENSAHPRQAFDTLEQKLTTEQKTAASKKFDDELKDVSTPDGMAQLLLKIWKDPILTPASKDLLLDIMARCETGAGRLKGALPPGTEVRHKTGTIGGTTNDVGIITLPGDGGHLIVAAFVKASEKEIPVREQAIANVTRALYDYFLIFR